MNGLQVARRSVVARAVTFHGIGTHDGYWQAALARYVEPNTPEKWDMRTILSWCSHHHRTSREARTCRQKLAVPK